MGHINQTKQVNDDVIQTMKDLPQEYRPYEKCRTYGAAALRDSELLSIILRTGSPGESVLSLSERLLAAARTGGQGLCGLYHLSYRQLRQIRGIGDVKALQLECIGEISRRMAREAICAGEIFTSPEAVADYYMESMRHEEQEKVLLIMLDSKGKRMAEEMISLGTVNASVITPREIFLTALRYRAVSIILLHNHPSGDPTPSSEDILLTRRVHSSGELLGISLLDHVIIGDRIFYSFASENCL